MSARTSSTEEIKEARRELASDSGRYLCVCSQCKTRHFDSDRRCPACGAGLYYQCWSEDDRPIASHDNYALAYAARAERLRAQAETCDALAGAHRAAAAAGK